MVAVCGALGVDNSFNNAAKGASRVCSVKSWGDQGGVRLGDLFDGGISRMRKSIGRR